MSAPLQRLEWDSAFFGFGIGRVTSPTLTPDEAEQVTREALDTNLLCVYYLASGDSAASWRAAASAGFDPIDIRLELAHQTPPRDHPRTLATAADGELLVQIARQQAFSPSRFFRDDRFPAERASDMFALWTLHGIREDTWFTAVERKGSAIDGFVTARMSKESGSVELVAVAPHARGRGVGGRVLAGALSELAHRGAKRVTVVTQGSNLPAQRLYLNSGFRPSNCGLWFHWWKVNAR